MVLPNRGTVLFLAPVPRASGNATTTARVAGYFEEAGREVVVVDVGGEEVDVCRKLETYSNAGGVDLVILLHAWRAGRYLRYISGRPKVVLIFGGTDLNEMVRDPDRERIMRAAVARSDRLVCFTDSMKQIAITTWLPPTSADQQYAVIPQAVTARLPTPHVAGGVPTDHAAAGDRLMLHLLETCGVQVAGAHGGRDEPCVLIAPMGIRGVKDPLSIMADFAAVHRMFPNAWLLYLGIVHDEKLHAVLSRQREAGILFHDAVPQGDLHVLFCSRFTAGVVNCSRSEGQPQAAMEAMLCGVPALLRTIPGNVAVSLHEPRPVASYFDPSQKEAFQHAATRLITDKSYARTLGESGQEVVRAHYSREAEQAAYMRVLQELAPEADGGALAAAES